MTEGKNPGQWIAAAKAAELSLVRGGSRGRLPQPGAPALATRMLCSGEFAGMWRSRHLGSERVWGFEPSQKLEKAALFR